MSRSSQIIDLKVNGRLFPTYILARFPTSKLPDILTEGDPCNANTTDVKKNLRQYQEFIGYYLDFKSPFKDILIYHGLGSGKTATSINVYNILYNYTPGWNVFILIKASLRGGWIDDIKKWLRKDEYEFRYKNIIFIHYDSPIADRQFLDAVKNVDGAKKNMFIIDEVHNFIRNVYSNITSNTGKRAQVIYDYIVQDKLENKDTRTLVISATPAVNNPFELALLFNLLRPGIFPKSEVQFNNLFISDTGYASINTNKQNLFQRRIMGLVSYYYGATPDYFASKTVHYEDVPMSEYQEEIYNFYEEIEETIARKSKGTSQTYKSYTRQSCNFVFPPISQTVTGELRPRPGKFRISEKEAEKLLENRDIDTKNDHKTQYIDAINLFVKSFDEYLGEKDRKDREQNYTIIKDVEIFINKYKGNYKEFHKSEKKKSTLYNAMYMCSAKMLHIIFNIMFSAGPTQVYSNYVLMEGLQIFKVYLKYFGFYNYMIKKELQKGKIGYIEFHGGIKDIEDRYNAMREFNKPENRFGEYLKIILISPAGAEGLNLRNVRQVHIMEPYWNEVRISQMMGRAIRLCSHADLPAKDRHVDVFRYRSVRTKDSKITTDKYIEDLARSKDSLIQSFLNSMKEVAVDCVLNKNHNKIAEDINCFQFEEPSLFNEFTGPAYKEDINDDVNFDNGMNSKNSIMVKVKVLEIKAVKLLSKPDEEIKYSKPSMYWYYSKNGTVYDHDLHYVIGKVAMDADGLPIKLDKDTYIIDRMVNLDLIKM